MMPPQLAQLSAQTLGRGTLRWTIRDGISTRCYEMAEKGPPVFCVSTRSTEVMLVLQGEMTVVVGPQQQYVRVGADQACVVPKGTPHTCHTDGGTRFVVFDLMDLPVSEAGVALLSGGDMALETLRLAGALWQEAGAVGRQELEDGLRSLRAHLDPGRFMRIEPVHHTLRMQSLKQYMESCYMGCVDLNELAARFRADPHYLVRAFKRNFGVPPMAYVQFLRTEHFVWQALRQAGKRSTDLASEAGFGDYSTFCRRMHERFGKPPSRLVVRV